MKIGLQDVDGHNFPNLALMKLSSYHKALGDDVEFVRSGASYDKVYKSKVFSFTPDRVIGFEATEVICGGTGYDFSTVLSDAVEHTAPDYGLYPLMKLLDRNTALGFTTRGCTNLCPWCIVPKKEGLIAPHADLEEFLCGRGKVILMDNNILAHQHGIRQIEKIITRGIRTDFNQGLDFRLMDGPTVRLLSRVRYIRFLRIACDHEAFLSDAVRAIKRLVKAGIPPYRIFVYCLMGTSLEETHQRIMTLAAEKVSVFAQPFRDFEPGFEVPKLHKAFATWVNHRPTFHSCTWQEYAEKHGIII